MADSPQHLLQCYILLFFAMAFAGWVMEVICKLFRYHRFINRGFLIGPYCPIYGFGAVLITFFLSGFTAWPLVVFFSAILLCGTLEYLTSYVMEKLYHARWWDYSHRRFNLNGRICAGTLIPFGLLGLGMLYLVKPLLFHWFQSLPLWLLNTICIVLCGLITLDALVSAKVLGKIKATANLKADDNTEELTRAVKEQLYKDGMLVRRSLGAFPNVKLFNKRLAEKAKEKHRQRRLEMEAHKQKIRAEREKQEARLRADLKALKEKRRAQKDAGKREKD